MALYTERSYTSTSTYYSLEWVSPLHVGTNVTITIGLNVFTGSSSSLGSGDTRERYVLFYVDGWHVGSYCIKGATTAWGKGGCVFSGNPSITYNSGSYEGGTHTFYIRIAESDGGYGATNSCWWPGSSSVSGGSHGVGQYTTFSYPASITNATAPTSVLVNKSCQIPNGDVVVSWSGATAGNGQSILGYIIYWKDNSNPTTSSYTGRLQVGNINSYTLSASSTRGAKRYYKVLTLGSGEYDSEISDARAYCSTNTKPSAPTSIVVNTNDVIANFLVKQGKVSNGFRLSTATAGSGGYGGKTVYYKRSKDGTGSWGDYKEVIIGSYLETFNDCDYYYTYRFYTKDELNEYSDGYVSLKLYKYKNKIVTCPIPTFDSTTVYSYSGESSQQQYKVNVEHNAWEKYNNNCTLEVKYTLIGTTSGKTYIYTGDSLSYDFLNDSNNSNFIQDTFINIKCKITEKYNGIELQSNELTLSNNGSNNWPIYIQNFFGDSSNHIRYNQNNNSDIKITEKNIAYIDKKLRIYVNYITSFTYRQLIFGYKKTTDSNFIEINPVLNLDSENHKSYFDIVNLQCESGQEYSYYYKINDTFIGEGTFSSQLKPNLQNFQFSNNTTTMNYKPYSENGNITFSFAGIDLTNNRDLGDYCIDSTSNYGQILYSCNNLNYNANQGIDNQSPASTTQNVTINNIFNDNSCLCDKLLGQDSNNYNHYGKYNTTIKYKITDIFGNEYYCKVGQTTDEILNLNLNFNEEISDAPRELKLYQYKKYLGTDKPANAYIKNGFGYFEEAPQSSSENITYYTRINKTVEYINNNNSTWPNDNIIYKKFNLLDAEPDDWTTNYNNYYFKIAHRYCKNSFDEQPNWNSNTYYELENPTQVISEPDDWDDNYMEYFIQSSGSSYNCYFEDNEIQFIPKFQDKNYSEQLNVYGVFNDVNTNGYSFNNISNNLLYYSDVQIINYYENLPLIHQITSNNDYDTEIVNKINIKSNYNNDDVNILNYGEKIYFSNPNFEITDIIYSNNSQFTVKYKIEDFGISYLVPYNDIDLNLNIIYSPNLNFSESEIKSIIPSKIYEEQSYNFKYNNNLQYLYFKATLVVSIPNYTNKTYSYTTPIYTYYALSPTVSYRPNCLGINTNEIYDVNASDIIRISKTSNKNTITLSNAQLNHTLTMNENNCTINNFTIDAGTWTQGEL